MLLSYIYLLLFFGISVLLVKDSYKYIRLSSLLVTGIVFILSTLLVVTYDNNSSFFQFVLEQPFFFNIKILNTFIFFGLDGISLYFVFLTAFLTFLCIIFIWEEVEFRRYAMLLLLLELILILAFSVLDVFCFYVLFEFILVPMFFIVGVWGSREKKIRASYLLVFYTTCSSIPMLMGLIYIFSEVGTFNLLILSSYQFSYEEQLFLFFSFFLSFASKIPLFPLHIWLPEAHVEAPTVGSVLLAGILLKVGVYGFIRYCLLIFPEACIFFSPYINTLAVVGLLAASMAAIKQTDLKKVIAYSSIAHMDLVVLGIFSGNIAGIEGAILQSISHGFVSSALFFLIGMIYKRYHTRELYYYGGIVQTMPLFSSFFLFFILCNIALPGTSNFVGEFLILLGTFSTCSIVICFFAAFGVILSGCYSLWFCNKILFGNIKTNNLLKSYDITFQEFFILFLLAIASLFLGVYPEYFLSAFHNSVLQLNLFSNVFK